MELSQSARYALYAAMELARAGEAPVTVGEVAGTHHIPEAALAKVFQQLVRADLAVGIRGVGGGYLLARPAADITVLDLISVFDRTRPKGRCLLTRRGEGPCVHDLDCRLRHLVEEVDEGARSTYASVTLETLVRPAALAVPAPAPVAVRRRG